MKTNNYLKKTAMAFIAFACLLFISSEVLAAVPLRINYQGRLKQSGLPVNSSVTMRFRIVNSGDTATYWDSGNVGVTVSSGLFNYVLTGGTPDLTTVAWADIVPYLKVTIGGTDLTPLEQINASAYSMYASSSSYSFTTNASGHDHDSTYVNVTGDAMSGQLTVGSSVTITATGMTPGLAVSSGAVFGTTSGNVGIGTVSPSNKLDVNGFIEAGGADTITSNPPTVDSDAGWKLGFYGNQYAMGVASWTMALRMYGWFSIFDNVLPANDASESVPDSNAHVAFSADRSYFAGKVGVGTTSPGSKFELVNGSITVSGTNAGLAVRGWSAGFVQSDADGDLTVGTIGSGDLPSHEHAAADITTSGAFGGTGVYTFPNTLTVTSSVTFQNGSFSINGSDLILENKNIGIGTSPSATFHVKDSATAAYTLLISSNNGNELFSVDSDGNVTVARAGATTGLTRIFTIQGTRTAGGSPYARLSFNNYDGGNYDGAKIESFNDDGINAGDLRFYTTDNASFGNAQMVITGLGNVGVGTETPNSKFDLVGGSMTISGTNAGLAVRGWSAGFVQSDADGDLTVGTIGSGDLPGHEHAAADITTSGAFGGTGVYTFPNTLTVTSSVTFLNSGFSVAGSTFVIMNGGRVGIGEGSPLSRLHVYSTGGGDGITIDGTANPALRLANAGSVLGRIGLVTSNNAIVLGSKTNDMVFKTAFSSMHWTTDDGSSIAMTVTPTNRIGIATATPMTKFEVAGGSITVSGGAGYGLTVKSMGAGWVKSTAFGDLYSDSNVGSHEHAAADITTSGAFGGTGVYTFPNTLTVTSSVTFLNSGFSVAVGTFVIDSSGYVGIGTATPLYPLHAVSNYNTDCFVFDGYSATGNEKDIFTIVDKDGGSSGGQDESSILKVLKENNWNNNDDGATLVELTYNAAVPSVDDRHFYMLGRAGSGIDEGIVSWGIALADSDFWTSGSIRAGATGKDMQGSGAAGFDSQTIALETSTHSYINTGSGFGLGTATPVRQMHIYGAGQEATDLTDSGNTGGTLYIQDSGSASNNGGAIIFGASQGYFAGIKSAMDDGTANTTGDLLFQTRNDTSDTSLTTRMYIKRGGQVGVGGDPGANDFRVMGGSNFIGVVTSTNTSNQVYAVYAP